MKVMLMNKILKLVLISIVLLKGGLSFACDPCALYSALNTGHNKEGAISLTLFEQLTSFEKGNEDEFYSLKNGERIKEFSTTQFNLNYGVSDHFSLQLSVPFIVRYLDEITNFRANSTTDAGFGDISLLAQYSDSFSLGEGFKLLPVVYGGVKLPTGDTGSLGEETSLSTKHHPVTGGVGAGRILTFGSGSYDFPLGGSLTLVKDRIILPAGAQYTIRTEGKFDYQFANDLFWYTNPGYFVLLDDDFSVSVHAYLSGENKGADERDNERVSLSSFSNLFLGPSVGVTFKSNLSGELAYQVRLTDKDNGIIVPEDRLRLALSYQF
jgi:hypothetical protein